MAANLFISYDLINPGQNYPNVAEAIKALGSWAKCLESFWYLRSNYSAQQALERVRAAADRNDKIIVVDSTNNEAAWVNIDPTVARHLQQRWNGAVSAHDSYQR